MQVAPIRSPFDMQRAQSRLKALDTCLPSSPEDEERAALRDAIAHYRCITETTEPSELRHDVRPLQN